MKMMRSTYVLGQMTSPHDLAVDYRGRAREEREWRADEAGWAADDDSAVFVAGWETALR